MSARTEGYGASEIPVPDVVLHCTLLAKILVSVRSSFHWSTPWLVVMEIRILLIPSPHTPVLQFLPSSYSSKKSNQTTPHLSRSWRSVVGLSPFAVRSFPSGINSHLKGCSSPMPRPGVTLLECSVPKRPYCL